jgi:hypothetical protein
MATEPRTDRWRKAIVEKLQSMQSKRQQFSDLVGWRAACDAIETSDVEQWWVFELLKCEAMLEDAATALQCIPEVTPRRVKRTLSCLMASGMVRVFGVLRLGEDLATVRAQGNLERGIPRPIVLPTYQSNLIGRRTTRIMQIPQVPPSAEQTLFIETQVEKQVEAFLQWVASGVAVERWERNA